MAITAYTGPPGSGKSHALVKEIVIPAVLSGRRVLSNIDGLNADAIKGYCLERIDDASKLGEVVVFHGDDALKPGFFPDETTAPGSTFVQAGDLLVFDEWALYFPRRGKAPPGCNVEAFLRYHRHLTGPGGQATDVCIGTQIPADINNDYRALIAKSYKFKKLTALGAEGTYSWLLFDGHLQRKGEHYRNGTGKYDPEVFPLYASSAAAAEGTHSELRTNAKESVWSGWQAWAVVIGGPVAIVGGLWFAYSTFQGVGGTTAAAQAVAAPGGAPGPVGGPSAVRVAAPSPWRIVGSVRVDGGTFVIVADQSGGTRMLRPSDFEFDAGRPVRGLVDGKVAVAEDRIPQVSGGSGLGGLLQ